MPLSQNIHILTYITEPRQILIFQYETSMVDFRVAIDADLRVTLSIILETNACLRFTLANTATAWELLLSVTSAVAEPFTISAGCVALTVSISIT